MTDPKATEPSDEELRAIPPDVGTVPFGDAALRARWRAGFHSRDGEFADLAARSKEQIVTLSRLNEQLCEERDKLRTELEAESIRRLNEGDALRTENARLRAESMRGAVEALRETVGELTEAIERRLQDPDVKRRCSYAQGAWAELEQQETVEVIAAWLEQQAASQGQPTGDRCPSCGAPEVDAMTPRTVYACGSSDYDQRPGTFDRKCAPQTASMRGEKTG